MYAVRCPHCMRLLQLNRPVENTKMKCRNCGKVFVGSTSESSENAPPPAEVLGPARQAAAPAPLTAPAGGPPRPAVKRRAKSGRDKYVFTIISGVGIVLLVVLVIYLNHVRQHMDVTITVKASDVENARALYPGLRVVESSGDKAVLKGSIPRDEATTLKKLEKEGFHKPERVPPRPAPPTGSTGEPVVGPTPPQPVGPQPSLEEKLPDSDPSVEVMMTDSPKTTSDDSPNSGYLLGTLVSKVDYPIEQIDLDIYTHDADGKRRSPIRAKCSYIPAGKTMRVCVIYTNLPASEIKNIRAVARKPKRAAPGEVCWLIENTQRNPAEGKLTLTGEVVNPNDFPVKNLRVFVETFSSDGVQVPDPGVVQAANLEGEATTLPAKGQTKFTFTLNVKELGLESQVNRLDFLVRAWGQQ